MSVKYQAISHVRWFGSLLNMACLFWLVGFFLNLMVLIHIDTELSTLFLGTVGII